MNDRLKKETKLKIITNFKGKGTKKQGAPQNVRLGGQISGPGTFSRATGAAPRHDTIPDRSLALWGVTGVHNTTVTAGAAAGGSWDHCTCTRGRHAPVRHVPSMHATVPPHPPTCCCCCTLLFCVSARCTCTCWQQSCPCFHPTVLLFRGCAGLKRGVSRHAMCA